MASARGWRFLHPDLDAPDAWAGLSLSPTGGMAMNEESATVRQAILLLLTTLPGERVMRPDYGCHLHRLIFAPNDETTAGLAIHYVQHALDRWEPRITVTHLDANRSEQELGRLDIVLEYRLRSTQQPDRLMMSVDLGE